MKEEKFQKYKATHKLHTKLSKIDDIEQCGPFTSISAIIGVNVSMLFYFSVH